MSQIKGPMQRALIALIGCDKSAKLKNTVVMNHIHIAADHLFNVLIMLLI